MAGLPMGGGKGVILADEGAAKTPELLAAFGRAVESLGGAYVTAEDVGITDADMVEIAKHTKHVSGLPVTSGADAGGDPVPFTALGVYLESGRASCRERRRQYGSIRVGGVSLITKISHTSTVVGARRYP